MNEENYISPMTSLLSFEPRNPTKVIDQSQIDYEQIQRDVKKAMHQGLIKHSVSPERRTEVNVNHKMVDMMSKIRISLGLAISDMDKKLKRSPGKCKSAECEVVIDVNETLDLLSGYIDVLLSSHKG